MSQSKAEVTEHLSGYVIDAECVRKSPRAELVSRARVHSRDCGLMGHCAESGFVLVEEDGGVAFLDDEATLKVLDLIRHSDKEHGIRLRALREREGDRMQTSRVEEIESSIAPIN